MGKSGDVNQDEEGDGDGEYALVGLNISIKGTNKRWKKCNELRVHGEISGQAIVQWVTSGEEEVVRLFGKGILPDEEFRVDDGPYTALVSSTAKGPCKYDILLVIDQFTYTYKIFCENVIVVNV
jgi:hypothetical protein